MVISAQCIKYVYVNDYLYTPSTSQSLFLLVLDKQFCYAAVAANGLIRHRRQIKPPHRDIEAYNDAISSLS